MFQNSLFFVEKQEVGDDSADFSIRLNPEHRIFEGHFPGDPIVPGVCIFQIATELFGLIVPVENPIFSVKNAKFLNIIRPLKQREVNYQLAWEPAESGYVVKASVSFEDTKFAKISFKVCSNQ